MWSELRQAVRELAPVVINATGQPRLESFLAGVRDRTLILSPLATDALPTDLRDVELVCDAQSPFSLSGVDLSDIGEGRATAHLGRARMARPPSRRGHARLRVDQPRVLVVAAGSQLDVHAFPVLDISAHGCAIETFEPLEAGARIEAVELWGDRRMLRRCSAVVADTIPWRDAMGAQRHRVRILFSDAAPEPAHRDQVDDPDRIRQILQLCAFSGVPIRVEMPLDDHVVRARLVAAESDRLRFELDEPIQAARLRARFDLYAISYEMQVRTLADGANDTTAIETAYPLLLQRRRRRYQFRAKVPSGLDVTVQAVNPATGETQHHEVIDLSFGGFALRTDPATDVLWAGLTLEKLVLRTPTAPIPLGEARVLDTSNGVCRVELRTARAIESTAFVDLMARLRFPRLEVSDGSDFEAMIRLYKSVGLFGPHMKRNLEPESRLLFARNWKAMHDTPLCRTLVQRERGEPAAGVSALRAWENAWVIQHMVAARNLTHYQPGVLHMSYLDYVLPRPDGQYMIVFVNRDNRRIARFLDSFFALTGTPEAVARTPMSLWIHPGAEASTSSDLTVRPMRRSDHTLVENAAVRTLGKVAAAALSVRGGELDLPDTRATFAQHGLRRSRRIRIVTDHGTPLVALLEERASPGLNLTWLLNCSWVLPLAYDVPPAALARAAAELAAAPTDTTTGERFLMLPESVESAAFSAAGFEQEAGVDLYAYNRTGLHRWYYFLREHYGKQAIRAAQQVLEPVMDAS